jgi:glycosyltransferase involved in cell wall biosynthesis
MGMRLSVLIPTRNRGRYLSAAVSHLLQTSREDFEIVVSDASDEPTSVRESLAPWLGDARLSIIDNTARKTGRVSSMVENWSCALNIAAGEWVSIIGDDDVLDGSVMEFLDRIEKVAPQVGAISWSKCHFDVDVAFPREAKIPMGTKLMLIAGRDSVYKQAGWPNPQRPPTALASPYHGSVRRVLLEQIRRERNGNWFAFLNPDYDLGWSVAWIDQPFIVSERPFSVAGVSAASNSYAVRNAQARQKNFDSWIREARYLDGWGETASEFLGTLPMGVLGFRNAFCSRYGIESPVDLKNLSQCIRHCIQNQEDIESFERQKVEAAKYLSTKFQDDFGVAELVWQKRPSSYYAGLAGELLVLRPNVFCGNICEFSRIAFSAVRPVEYLFGNSMPSERME